ATCWALSRQRAGCCRGRVLGAVAATCSTLQRQFKAPCSVSLEHAAASVQSTLSVSSEHAAASVQSTLQRQFKAPSASVQSTLQRQFKAPSASLQSTLRRQFKARSASNPAAFATLRRGSP